MYKYWYNKSVYKKLSTPATTTPHKARKNEKKKQYITIVYIMGESECVSA